MNVLDNQPPTVDPFTRYSTHGSDAGSDHAWVDDTGLHMWILCFQVKTGPVYSGIPIAKDRDMLKVSYPPDLIGTPGRACGTRM